jgi:surface protein
MIRLLTPIGLALMTAQAFAQVQVPKSYSDGEVIYADELNTNLKAIADAVPPRDCTTDQIIKWNGSAWVCATGSLAGLACAEGQTIAYRDDAWQCGGCVPPGTAITNSNFDWAITDWFASGNDGQYGDITKWCTGAVTSMRNAFRDKTTFNEDISDWDTSNVTSMFGMFNGATSFNADIGGWDTSNVAEMVGVFEGATAFNRNISGWDTSNVTDMRYMFLGAAAFNQDLSSWVAGSLQACSDFATDATAWLGAYSGSIAGKTPPLSTPMIAAGCSE